MILIFGGTTEGRRCVEVCEEAGKSYYYSTKGKSQEITFTNGIRITGSLDQSSMYDFCQKNHIRLIVDAGHPFAEVLHQTISDVSEKLGIPVLRYERTYPAHEDDFLWFDSFQDAIMYLEKSNIDNLLALSGINTIAKLKSYWEKHNCWFRILDRDESRLIAKEQGFPCNNIIYYKQGEDENSLFQILKPKAIITKESGESGGFYDKVNAAKKLNIPVLVIKRPTLSEKFIPVYGENGLRKEIERYLPDFFELRTGYTTGTCATAATKSALTTLLTGEELNQISLTLPNGERIRMKIDSTRIENNTVSCTVIKDAGDDPDITNGHEIISTVNLNLSHRGVRFLQGKGVGTVTLPGLGLNIGEPAINKIPRMMIKREISKVLRHHRDKLPGEDLKTGIDVTISVPEGEKLALKTFNPKLGIIGGISIIGTSGIVKPYSSDAFIRSIRKEMQVAKAMGCRQVIINSGAKSEKFIKQQYPDLPGQAFIHYGNFIGETIKIASEYHFNEVVMGIMIGKAVKLAEGYLDTHSKKVVLNKDFLLQTAKESHCSDSTIAAINNLIMARQLWDIIPKEENCFFQNILGKCYKVCTPLFPDGKLKIMLIDENGSIFY